VQATGGNVVGASRIGTLQNKILNLLSNTSPLGLSFIKVWVCALWCNPRYIKC